MSLWPATRDSVRQHLFSLGYDDVPEAVLDEFVDDLNRFHVEQDGVQSARKTAASSTGASNTVMTARTTFTESTLLPPNDRAALQDTADDFHRTMLRASATTNVRSTGHDAYLPPPLGVNHGSVVPSQLPQHITRDDVRQQLVAMGYGDDVPEAVLSELVVELNEAYSTGQGHGANGQRTTLGKTGHTNAATHTMKTTATTPKHSLTSVPRNAPVTSSRPPSTLSQKQRVHRPADLRSQSNGNRSRTIVSPAKVKLASHGDTGHVFESATVGTFDAEDDKSLLRQLADLELGGVRAKVAEQQRYQLAASGMGSMVDAHTIVSGDYPLPGATIVGGIGQWRANARDMDAENLDPLMLSTAFRRSASAKAPKPMLPTSTTTTRRPVSRKNDPVNKFHQFRAEWSRSSFLKRLEDPASSRAKHRMYGGVGYHAAMGGNVFERK